MKVTHLAPGAGKEYKIVMEPWAKLWSRLLLHFWCTCLFTSRSFFAAWVASWPDLACIVE